MSYGENHNRMYSTGLNYAIEDTREKWQKQQALDERTYDSAILLESRDKHLRHEFLTQQGENMGKSGEKTRKKIVTAGIRTPADLTRHTYVRGDGSEQTWPLGYQPGHGHHEMDLFRFYIKRAL